MATNAGLFESYEQLERMVRGVGVAAVISMVSAIASSLAPEEGQEEVDARHYWSRPVRIRLRKKSYPGNRQAHWQATRAPGE